MALVLGACGDNIGAEAPDDASVDLTSRYLPWKVGSTWTYRLTDPTRVQPPIMATTTVVEEVFLDAIARSAFRVHIEKLPSATNLSREVVASKDVYEGYEGDLDVRFRSDFFDSSGALVMTQSPRPFRIKLDEMTATPYESFYEMAQLRTGGLAARFHGYQWGVVASDEQVQVPAGTFTCLHVRRVGSKANVQDYWYARGVGKIKETGDRQIEELVSFTLAP